MRCYKVTAAISDENGVYHLKHYAETQACATAVKKEWMEKHSLKRSEVDIEKADIPLAKGDLLEFINGLVRVDS